MVRTAAVFQIGFRISYQIVNFESELTPFKSKNSKVLKELVVAYLLIPNIN